MVRPLLVASVLVASTACNRAAETGETGSPSYGPSEEFDRYCTHTWWEDTLTEAVLGDSHGATRGGSKTRPAGDVEAMGFTVEHPMRLSALRVNFTGGRGTAVLKILTDYGGSYADIENPDALLLETQVEVEVAVADDEGEWFEFDVSEQGLLLHPAQKYFLAYEHLDKQPFLRREEVAKGDRARAALWDGETWYTPTIFNGNHPRTGATLYLYPNYSMELVGETFCQWTDGERWFGTRDDAPWAEVRSQRATISDVDGDGLDDLVVNDGSPLLYLNQGGLEFAEPAEDPWPDADRVGVMVFGDLDNDGDPDALGLRYSGNDADGDGELSGLTGDDCNDADASVEPGATEVINGHDDDCDGIEDELVLRAAKDPDQGGQVDADWDRDGYRLIDGDCDDHHWQTYPGAEEVLDRRDNDCDLKVDEDFVNLVLLNDGTGRFAHHPCPDVERTDPSAAGALADADGDGVLDAYYGNWLKTYPNPSAIADRYLVGDGAGCFTASGTVAGIDATMSSRAGANYGVVWADYDNDGDADLYVSNYGYGQNELYENLGDGTFDEVGSQRGVSHDPEGGDSRYGGNTFGADWGDLDNDGDLDLYAANIAHPRYQPFSDISQLLINGGGPDWEFEDARVSMGLPYEEGDVNASFGDYDNDGDLDLVVATLYGGHYASLFRNDGEVFTEVSYETGVAVHDAVSAVWSDVDLDGDLDLVIADRSGLPRVQLFENRLEGLNHWVELRLVGTTSNRDAIGARVTLVSGEVTRIREVKGGGGHSGNQSTLMVHFGLGRSDAVDELTVQWPGGALETFTGVAADGLYQLVEGDEAATPL